MFLKYFFSKQYIKLLYKLNLELMGNYTNNLAKSSIYCIFYNLLNFLQKKKINFLFYLNTNTYLFNIYFFSIRVLNTRVNNLFYKNIFFFLMLMSPLM